MNLKELNYVYIISEEELNSCRFDIEKYKKQELKEKVLEELEEYIKEEQYIIGGKFFAGKKISLQVFVEDKQVKEVEHEKTNQANK